MDTHAAHPCPYTMPDPPTSSGRALLSRLMWEYCCMQWGLSGGEVAAGLCGTPADDEDLDDYRTRVETAARLIGGVLADGRVRAFARPLGGGEPIGMRPGLWELDDFRPRFAASALDLGRPFDTAATPTHWIFVDAEDGRRLLDATCGEPGYTRPARRRDAPAAPPDIEAPTSIPIEQEGDRLVRLPEVMRRTGLGRSTIYARIEAGRFPRQAPMDGNIAAWWDSDVGAWLAARR